MRVGVPREIKASEDRVALTPAAAHALVLDGHEVLIEREAGAGSGFVDGDYAQAGCALGDAVAAWSADLVAKVKEPQVEEYGQFRDGLILFSYLHLAPAPVLTAALCRAGVTAIGLETVQRADGLLPLLAPMSEIAGRMAVPLAAYFLARPQGGSGVLVGGVPGVPPAHVVICGGGTVGLGAARIACGMGARVTILDTQADRLRALEAHFGGRAATLASQPYAVAEAAASADILVGAVLVPGARAPKVVTAEMVARMRPGSVIVDVAVDQGGCVETCDHATTHQVPTYVRSGIVHYAVANIPGAVPRTATAALANATLPYLRHIAALGWRGAAAADPALAKGINTACGAVVCGPVAEAQGLPLRALADVL